MAAFPRRYAVYFADLNPTVGGEIRKVRPVVVVSQDEMLKSQLTKYAPSANDDCGGGSTSYLQRKRLNSDASSRRCTENSGRGDVRLRFANLIYRLDLKL